MRKTPKLLGENIPFVQAAHVGDRQRPTAILLRTSFTTGDKGAALGIANAWHRSWNRTESCHYVVDEFQAIRCVPDVVEAYNGSGPIRRVISVNVCHDPPEGPTTAVYNRTARLVARLCKLYRIRPVVLSDEEEARWLKHRWKSRGGIILKTAGDFPVDWFSISVTGEMATV